MMSLEDCRRFYADEIRYVANLRSAALVEAFARVPRENFVGAGPWLIGSPDLGMSGVTYSPTEDANPQHVYHNVTIALDPARNLNNGQPSALAFWISALNLKPGDRVFHLGCGVGYYTAIMAEVVGPGGRVAGSEVDAVLAERAQRNLAGYPNVMVHAGDGATFDPGPCDAMLINAGVTHPLPLWLDRLNEGGTIVLPLTIPLGTEGVGKGVMVRIVRERGAFSARVVTYVAIYSCTSVRDAHMEHRLGKTLAKSEFMKMRSLRRDLHDSTGTCVLHGEEGCFSSEEAVGKD